jgi:hypothetical protein
MGLSSCWVIKIKTENQWTPRSIRLKGLIWVSRVVGLVPSSDRKVTSEGRDSLDEERLELLLRLRVRSVEGTSRKLDEVDEVDDDAE